MSAGPDDGRGVAEQLEVNAAPLHVPLPVKRIHRVIDLLTPEEQERLRSDLAEMARMRRRAEASAAEVRLA